MAGGEGNPLGARALYLGDTLYRIHGTNQPSTIGNASLSLNAACCTNGKPRNIINQRARASLNLHCSLSQKL
jgi:hypothetical protein